MKWQEETLLGSSITLGFLTLQKYNLKKGKIRQVLPLSIFQNCELHLLPPILLWYMASFVISQ